MNDPLNSPEEAHPSQLMDGSRRLSVGLLTGGDDRPYALGMAGALAGQNIFVDFIGSDALDAPELHQSSLIRFLNLRGDQSTGAPIHRKIRRILAYYLRLVGYAFSAKPKIFHILWNSKFVFVDRVLLMLLYRGLGKRVVLTAHNVNGAKRDRRDSAMNRFTLRIQYSLCNYILVHTARMKRELHADFGVPDHKAGVIPFGINNTIPRTGMSPAQARLQLGINEKAKAILFFGQIAPYKGLAYLVEALKILIVERKEPVHLVIAGKVKQGEETYWAGIKESLEDERIRPFVIPHIRFIPDSAVEAYLTATDVVALPYVDIFQSGVPFLAYSFGSPVIATDVGSLREDIIEGKTGYIVPPQDPQALATSISRFFVSELFRDLPTTRQRIRKHANEQHSWTKVGGITREAYENLGISCGR